MPYQHGVRVLEQPTGVVAPITGTAGLQVVIGTAPINLAEDPAHVTNVPILCNTFAEAVAALGYSEDFEKYTLCQAMYASFKLFAVAPVIFINVLNPNDVNHTAIVAATSCAVSSLQAILETKGMLKSTVVVTHVTYAKTTDVTVDNTKTYYTKSGDTYTPVAEPAVADIGDYYEASDTALTLGTDYTLSFDDEGYLVVTLLATGAAAADTTVKVSGKKLDPTGVIKANIIGTYNSSTGAETGLEVIRQVFPKFGMPPGLLLAPGWSQDADVAAVLAAKCEEINGYFSCECIIDIDSGSSGAKLYTAVKAKKDAMGLSSPHALAVWPCVKCGDKVLAFSAVMAALTARTDAANDDVPNLSPSNKALGISGTCLADGTEVTLDQVQANVLNGGGIATAINVNGWRSWGNNSAAYPAVTDPKDRWWACRRFFSWWGNSFIQTYAQRVDDPANYRLIESIVDSENIRGQSYVPDKCAGIRIEYLESENTVADLLDGKVRFHQYLAPYTPAEDILNVLEFDADALTEALTGGE